MSHWYEVSIRYLVSAEDEDAVDGTADPVCDYVAALDLSPSSCRVDVRLVSREHAVEEYGLGEEEVA